MQNPSGLDGVRGLNAQKHAVLEHVTETEHVMPSIKGPFQLQFLALENLNKSNRVQNGAVQVAMFLRTSVTFGKLSFGEKLFLIIPLNDLLSWFDRTKQLTLVELGFSLFILDCKTCSLV